MPLVFINPSAQADFNFLGGGTERQYMNRIVDEMEPFLNESGIRFVRSTPGTGLGDIIKQSNLDFYDLHLSLCSDVSPKNLSGRLMGADIYYYSYNLPGKIIAEVIAENYKKIYHDPVLAKAVSTSRMTEVIKTNAPAILVKTAYRDNEKDVQWLKQNTSKIAENIVGSLAHCFGIRKNGIRRIMLRGVVATQGEKLSVLDQPDLTATVLEQVSNGEPISILGVLRGWYLVETKGKRGYADARAILL